MLASEIIVPHILPIHLSDLGEDVLRQMEDHVVRHLPIVDQGEVIGIISDEDILDRDIDATIESYNLPYKPAYVKEDDHIFEVLEIVALTNLTCIPVVDKSNHFKGVITLESLVHNFAIAFSFNESGTIIVLELNRQDYSMAEISRIIESENGHILSSFVTRNAETGTIYVTIKVNLHKIQYVVAAFERYDYIVKATFTESEYIDTIQERYESLMHYLNI